MSKKYLYLYLIIFVAIGFRLGVALYLGDTAIRETDEYSYSVLASRLAQGYGYSFEEYWYPFTPAGTPTAHWSFLYTGFVAGLYWLFGIHPLVVRLVQAALGGIFLPWLTFRLARQLFPNNERIWLLSAACSSVYAFFVYYAAMIMTETLFIAALLWTMERAIVLHKLEQDKDDSGRVEEYASSKNKERQRWITAICLGIGLGITALLRQSIMPWVLVLFIWLLPGNILSVAHWSSENNFRRLIRLIAVGVTMMIFILPFTIRNHIVYHDFLLLNSNAGYAMYSAQHPLHGTSFQAFLAAPLPEDLSRQNLNEAEWDRVLMRRGLEEIKENPARYILLSASRVLDFFEFWPTDTSLIHNLGRLLSFTLLLPFSVIGLWVGIKKGRKAKSSWRKFWICPVMLPLLFIFCYSILHIFTWAMPRYRLPVDAVTIPFAALALINIWLFFERQLPVTNKKKQLAEET